MSLTCDHTSRVSPMDLLTGVVSARALLAGPGLHVLHRVGCVPEHLLAAEGAGHVTGGVHLDILKSKYKYK